MGQEYQGISRWFSPFPISDEDFGRVPITVNAYEKPGRLTVEPISGPVSH